MNSEEQGERGPGWTIVVPVKRAGKTRLDVSGDRIALARAIALDTITAAAACELVDQVVVVTDDGSLPLHAAGIPGLRFVSDDGPPGSAPAASRLDAAVARGMSVAGDGMRRAALLGDLPALRSDDLAAALRLAAAHDRGVVADAEGTGSTLVTAAPGIPWTSAFGAGSFARHTTLGCAALAIPDASSLRRDVDTPAQLDAAASLGLGPHTTEVLSLR